MEYHGQTRLKAEVNRERSDWGKDPNGSMHVSIYSNLEGNWPAELLQISCHKSWIRDMLTQGHAMPRLHHSHQLPHLCSHGAIPQRPWVTARNERDPVSKMRNWPDRWSVALPLSSECSRTPRTPSPHGAINTSQIIKLRTARKCNLRWHRSSR